MDMRISSGCLPVRRKVSSRSEASKSGTAGNLFRSYRIYSNCLTVRNKGLLRLLEFGTMQHKISHYTFLFILFLASKAQAQLELGFSEERGFYNGPFDLMITPSNPDATIRYTLNGTEPSTTYGTIYSDGISVSTTTVLRAIAYVEGIDTTEVNTHSFLFLDDVIQQSETIDGWPSDDYNVGTGGATAEHTYGMDPEIVNSPLYINDIIKGLEDIPSLSIVMDKDDFWNMYDGNAETKTSIELLYASDPTKNEQVDCGIEAHSHKRLKRSMRLSFKNQYGPGKWDSDIFKNAVLGSENAVDEFDRIVLRAGNNRAWTRNWNEDRTAFTRDEWFRQSQIASSGIGSHGTFVHLYVNGLYWGLYNPVERPDEGFTSVHFGGSKSDWFAVSHGGDKGGDDTRYDYLMNTLSDQDLSVSSKYSELKEYLDVPKFCDYILLSWMTGVQDWPNNNWWGGNRNNPSGPFMYFGWDNEWSWDLTNNANNGAWVHPQFESGDVGGSKSAKVFNAAKFNKDFMMALADRVYKLCFNNGPMSDDNSRLRWSSLNGEIEDAVIAESARWGDALEDGVTRTRDIHWANEVDRLDDLMDGNVDRLMNALYAENYYPLIDPPLFENDGTAIEVQEISVAGSYSLDLTNPNTGGEIYYTLDGTDPRFEGGAVSDGAINYVGGAISFTQSATLMARVKNGNDWSALHCLKLFVDSDLSGLKLTEIMYHPADFGEVSGKELEFLEIKNTSTSLSTDLSGVEIVDGVKFQFPIGTSLAPQGFIILASNPEELMMKCPDTDIFGQYTGQLRNSGEKVAFMNFGGDTIIALEYDDDFPWPTQADGDGYSLVSSLPNPVGNQDDHTFWVLSSDNFCGSPGADDFTLNTQTPNQDKLFGAILYPNPVMANTVLTLKTEEEVEQIQLFNVFGQKLISQILSQEKGKIILQSPVVSGAYILRINYENGIVESKRFIVN